MRKVVVIIWGLFMYGSLFAQQNTADLTEISDMEKRMTAMEKIISELPKISGFINMRYRYNGESNSFDIRRARLDFKGDLATKLDYRFQMEFAGSPKLLDAYLRCKIDRRFNLQVGEFKIPFSMENHIWSDDARNSRQFDGHFQFMQLLENPGADDPCGQVVLTP